MTAAEMTDALVQINDQLVEAARARGSATVTFLCECGECLADEVPLSLDKHEEIRAHEDLIFVQGHEAPRRYRRPTPPADGYSGDRRALDSAEWLWSAHREPHPRSHSRVGSQRAAEPP